MTDDNDRAKLVSITCQECGHYFNKAHATSVKCPSCKRDIYLIAATKVIERHPAARVTITKEMVDAYLKAQGKYCSDRDKMMYEGDPQAACAEGLRAALTAARVPESRELRTSEGERHWLTGELNETKNELKAWKQRALAAEATLESRADGVGEAKVTDEINVLQARLYKALEARNEALAILQVMLLHATPVGDGQENSVVPTVTLRRAAAILRPATDKDGAK